MVSGVTVMQPLTQEQMHKGRHRRVSNTPPHTHTRRRKVEHWWVAGFPLKHAEQKTLAMASVHARWGLCTLRLLCRFNVNFGLFFLYAGALTPRQKQD